MAELRSLVLEGPDLERNKVVRWRCADLRAEIAARWSVTLTEGTVGKLLHRLRMTRLQPRPGHPKKDAAAQEKARRCRLRPQTSPSRCGFRTKPEWGRRDHWSISGHRLGHVPRWCATTATT